MRNVLKREDYLLLGEIINNSYKILDCLDSLALLELNNNTGSDTFRKNIKEIDKLNKYENSLYNYLFKDIDKTSAFLDFLGDSEEIYDLKNNLDILVYGSDEDKAKLRMGLILINHVSNHFNELSDNLDEDDEEEEEEFEDESVAIAQMRVSKCVKHDLINSLFCMINKYEKEEKYEDIKPYFIGLKYAAVFIYKGNFEELLNNSFNIDRPLYWTADFIADLNNIREEEVTSFRQSYYLGLLDTYLSHVVLVNPEDLEDEDKYASFVYELMFINSGLLFADSDMLEDLRTEVEGKLLDADNDNLNKDAINELLNIINKSTEEIKEPIRLRKIKDK